MVMMRPDEFEQWERRNPQRARRRMDQEQREHARRRWRFVLVSGFVGLIIAAGTADAVFGYGAGEVVIFFGSILFGSVFWFGMFRIWCLRG